MIAQHKCLNFESVYYYNHLCDEVAWHALKSFLFNSLAYDMLVLTAAFETETIITATVVRWILWPAAM